MKHEKLTAYSIIVDSFLFAKNNVEAGIVHTDIVPDILLEKNVDFDLFLDLYGIYDFRFAVHTGRSAVWGGYYGSNSFTYLLDTVINMHLLYFSNNAMVTQFVTATNYAPLGSWCYTNLINLWNYNLLNGEDQYTGNQFYDEHDCLHYSWIKCAVVDSNEQFVIRDFAIETYCDWTIETADKTGGHVDINKNFLSGANIYCSESNIVIDLT